MMPPHRFRRNDALRWSLGTLGTRMTSIFTTKSGEPCRRKIKQLEHSSLWTGYLMYSLATSYCNFPCVATHSHFIRFVIPFALFFSHSFRYA
ncbi:hypothetical protein BT96DRAFT_40538 [Gymnopus androsaceus JB14]|uniref:Uncharacterized protein n=1 Tax=Gymnopus androsaceus JB14 TaxID=1447944 RepID=A0A6A4HMA8_9AGAR|nr:hypothetical protein BT96DRAFT_40538 [Gymnopus androsaceus JB14]